MQIELIAHTTGLTDTVERAAAVCYDSKPTKEHRIAMACARSGHMSVWEHISFTFHVSGVSRALLAQLSRHRHISLSVRSQRYCDEDGFRYIKPDSVRSDSVVEWRYDDAMDDAQRAYHHLRAMRINPEDARMVLPNACMTELYMTANARALIEISHLRLCMRAQAEIRTMFTEIREAVRAVAPEVADLMVPKCEQYEVAFCMEHCSCGRHLPGRRRLACGGFIGGSFLTVAVMALCMIAKGEHDG